ncbi:tetratricopeptide repeat protein [Anthocerotibacter panamensis]|uniref:tetratricopeptide repeat protein n=1 Tax=Anthocerotibacter panamensis TaxID=2857077 RepID=UPI001C4080EC|nr:tetratricopeptide repeat protein [Anthocerotibacter panamensis]
MTPFVDYYSLLELAPTASPEAIKQAFHRLARKYHPDVAGPASQRRFQEINEAYQTLSDPQQRYAYDQRFQEERRPKPMSEPAPPGPGIVFRTSPLRPTGAQQELKQGLQQVKQALKNRQYTVAITQAEALLQQFPQDKAIQHQLALACQRLGNALIYRGDYRQAKVYLTRALDLEPDNAHLVFEVKRDLARLNL